MKRIAVIGAGIAGLTSARGLVRSGFTVKVFDKGRGPGGRISNRKEGDLRFDHGTPFFRASRSPFIDVVAAWSRQGHVSSRRPRMARVSDGRASAELDNRWIFGGTPAMNRLARHLATDLDLVSGERVSRLVRRSPWWEAPRWQIVRGERLDEDEFDLVILAIPPVQAARLLSDASHWQRRLAGVIMDPCLTAMVSFASPLGLPWDVIHASDGDLAQAVRQPKNFEPNDGGGESWVLHATTEFSREHVNVEPQAAAWQLLHDLAGTVGSVLPEVRFLKGHRWRYARTRRPLGTDFLYDPDLGLAVCGDWCRGSDIEDAFLSGASLAVHVGSQGRTGPSASIDATTMEMMS